MDGVGNKFDKLISDGFTKVNINPVPGYIYPAFYLKKVEDGHVVIYLNSGLSGSNFTHYLPAVVFTIVDSGVMHVAWLEVDYQLKMVLKYNSYKKASANYLGILGARRFDYITTIMQYKPIDYYIILALARFDENIRKEVLYWYV